MSRWEIVLIVILCLVFGAFLIWEVNELIWTYNALQETNDRIKITSEILRRYERERDSLKMEWEKNLLRQTWPDSTKHSKKRLK